MPIGSPSVLKPAGRPSAGRPECALSWQFEPPWPSPIRAGLRLSVGYASAAS